MTTLPAQARRSVEDVVRAGEHLRSLLDAAEAAPPAEGVDAVANELAARLGASDVSMLIADISGLTLARLARRATSAGPAGGATQSVAIAGTSAGAALMTQQTQQTRESAGVRVHVPVSQRGEAVGVLELLLAEVPSPLVLDHLAVAAQALAYVVIADRRFTDLYELGRRSSPLSLEAEIQRRLLPASYACEGPQFALAGWLVPADTAGGDTFDYSVDRDTLHLSITDGMGHGLPAAQLATLAVGSLRNSRRSDLGLGDQARRASVHVGEHAGTDEFVTALLGRLDLQTGELELVNAGHMNPLLVRGGLVTEIALEPGLVLGVAPERTYDVERLVLRPGDRLAFVTDGMSERDAAEAEIEALLGTLGHLHPRETVQVLTAAVLHVTGGAIRDDATVLVVDWYGGANDAPCTSSGQRLTAQLQREEPR